MYSLCCCSLFPPPVSMRASLSPLLLFVCSWCLLLLLLSQAIGEAAADAAAADAAVAEDLTLSHLQAIAPKRTGGSLLSHTAMEMSTQVNAACTAEGAAAVSCLPHAAPLVLPLHGEHAHFVDLDWSAMTSSAGAGSRSASSYELQRASFTRAFEPFVTVYAGSATRWHTERPQQLHTQHIYRVRDTSQCCWSLATLVPSAVTSPPAESSHAPLQLSPAQVAAELGPEATIEQPIPIPDRGNATSARTIVPSASKDGHYNMAGIFVPLGVGLVLLALLGCCLSLRWRQQQRAKQKRLTLRKEAISITVVDARVENSQQAQGDATAAEAQGQPEVNVNVSPPMTVPHSPISNRAPAVASSSQPVDTGPCSPPPPPIHIQMCRLPPIQVLPGSHRPFARCGSTPPMPPPVARATVLMHMQVQARPRAYTDSVVVWSQPASPPEQSVSHNARSPSLAARMLGQTVEEM